MGPDAATPAGRAWWLLLPPGLTAALTVAVLAYASGGFTAAPELSPWVTIGFVAWAIAPSVGLAVLVVAALRRGWRGRAALLVGGIVLLGFMAWSMGAIVLSDSSTSALGFLFLPLYAWAPVLLTGLVVLVLNLRRAPASARP